MTDRQKGEFEKNLELDYSFEIKDLCRFRGNAFHQSRGAAGVFRQIPTRIATLEELKSPAIFKRLPVRRMVSFS